MHDLKCCQIATPRASIGPLQVIQPSVIPKSEILSLIDRKIIDDDHIRVEHYSNWMFYRPDNIKLSYKPDCPKSSFERFIKHNNNMLETGTLEEST
jgi:hypothetical protein